MFSGKYHQIHNISNPFWILQSNQITLPKKYLFVQQKSICDSSKECSFSSSINQTEEFVKLAFFVVWCIPISNRMKKNCRSRRFLKAQLISKMNLPNEDLWWKVRNKEKKRYRSPLSDYQLKHFQNLVHLEILIIIIPSWVVKCDTKIRVRNCLLSKSLENFWLLSHQLFFMPSTPSVSKTWEPLIWMQRRDVVAIPKRKKVETSFNKEWQTQSTKSKKCNYRSQFLTSFYNKYYYETLWYFALNRGVTTGSNNEWKSVLELKILTRLIQLVCWRDVWG